MKNMIMIVEDNSGILEEIALLLQFSNYKVLNANNGKSALKLLSYNTPDIIISDLFMPYINGLDLLKAVRQDENNKDIPFILMTADNTKVKSLPDSNNKLTRVLVKPFSSEDLLDTIISLIYAKKNQNIKTIE